MNNTAQMLTSKTWAVVGATDNISKFGYKIYKRLKEKGYQVYPVNPKVEVIDGEKCYPSLSSLPVKPEAVNLVVPSSVGMDILCECANLKINDVWLQPGAESNELIELGKQLGLNVIHHACILVAIAE